MNSCRNIVAGYNRAARKMPAPVPESNEKNGASGKGDSGNIGFAMKENLKTSADTSITTPSNTITPPVRMAGNFQPSTSSSNKDSTPPTGAVSVRMEKRKSICPPLTAPSSENERWCVATHPTELQKIDTLSAVHCHYDDNNSNQGDTENTPENRISGSVTWRLFCLSGL